jgi:TolB-like protein/Tfp pilus assembly protein PilF
MGFIAELKRRNVFRVGIAYAVAAWVLLQMFDVIGDILELPEWGGKMILAVLVIGFFLALVLAWAFEMTPEGLKRESEVDRSQSIANVTGRKLDRAIIGVLVIALVYFVADKFLIGGPEIVVETAPAVVEMAEPVSPPPASAGRIDDKSIAVLPFAHRSANPDDQYFTDGIHDDLLTQLAKQDAFKVISRTSVMEYRDTTKNMKQIGEELGVRHILEGGVQRSGNRVRINMQLIDTVTDEHLWAETYDRELTTDNLFDIQSEITLAIANALHATLSGSSLDADRSAPTGSLAAYDLYLRGKQLTIGNTKMEWQAAVDLYQEAISIDPEFTLAYVGLAEAYLTLYWSYEGNLADREASRAAIDRAIALDPELPEIQMAEGFYHYWGQLDYEAALGYLDRAIALMPNNAQAHMWRGWTLRRAGRIEEALVSMHRSLELDPRAPFNWLEYGQTLSYLHRLDEALAAFDKTNAMRLLAMWSKAYTSQVNLQQGDVQAALDLSEETLRSTDPNTRLAMWEPLLLARGFPGAQHFASEWPPELETWRMRYYLKEALSATAYRLSGDLESARKAADQALERLLAPDSEFPDDYRKYFALAQVYAAANDRAGAVEQADLAFSVEPFDALVVMENRYNMARALALVGEKERALKLLEPLLPGPSSVSVRYVELDPHWDGLRDDPDFIALLNRYRD